MEKLTICVDNGHYGLKVYGGGAYAPFHMMSRARAGGASEEYFGGANVGNEEVVTTDNKPFTIGGMTSEKTTFDDFPLSPLNRVLVHSAIKRAGFVEGPLSVVLGLPFKKFYPAPLQKDLDLIKGMEENIKKSVQFQDGSPDLNIVDVHTMPEGVMAWFSYVMAEECKTINGQEVWVPKANAERYKSTTTIIDIGGQTTEIVTMGAGGAIQHDQSGSLQVGAHRILEATTKHLSQLTRAMDISEAKVREAIKNGTTRLRGKEYDLRDFINNEQQKILHSVISGFERTVLSLKDSLDDVIFAGGTSLDFKDLIKTKDGFSMHPDALFANSKGGYYFQNSLQG